MDGHRFDGLAKSVAAWSSRRRFLGTAAVAATGAGLARFGPVSAASTDLSSVCGPDASDIRGIIQDSSTGLQTDLTNNPPSLPESSKVNGPQLAELLQQVHCLLAQGSVAASDDWKLAQTRFFLNQAQGLVSAMSVGFTGSFFSEAPQAERAGAIRALRALKKSDICGHGGCIAGALSDELVCMHNCPTAPDHDKDTCQYGCFITFLRQLFVGTTTPAVDACLPGLVAACEGDCCAGNCISK
jgi:hypothetical protein